MAKPQTVIFAEALLMRGTYVFFGCYNDVLNARTEMLRPSNACPLAMPLSASDSLLWRGRTDLSHGTIRAATLPAIVSLITETYDVSDDEALKMFYGSHVGTCYADDESGLYGQSALYVLSMFQAEKTGVTN